MTTQRSHNKSSGLIRTLRRLGQVAVLGTIAMFLAGAPLDSLAEEPAEKKASVRYNRKSGKVKTKATLSTKFKKEQAKEERRKKQKVDMMSADQFAKQRQAVKQAISDKQINMLKRLLKATEPTDPDYPDFLFRLSDHYLDKKAYFELQSGALYEKIYANEDKGNKAQARQLKAKQKKFQKASREQSANAVKIYKVLVSNPAFGKYKRLDEALYFYAFELGQLKREGEMKDAYLRLIREYPQSRYIPNAYLSFADFYFGQNKIADALKLYQKIVTGYRDSPVYAYALYKMGWCYLNPIGTAEPQYQKSLQKFVETIKATLAGRAGSEANARQLRRDARRDLIKAYVHAGKPSKAWDFFTRVGNGPKKAEDMSRKMMSLLAVTYFGEGMYVESSSIYKKMQDLYPKDNQTCEWQGRIVVNALATDDKGIQWKETSKLGDYWEQFKGGKYKKAAKRKCRDEALDTMKQMATVWHDEAEKTRRVETYELAEQAYQKFLDTFPKDKDAYEMQYYYAEIKWARAVNLYNTKNKAAREEGRKKFKGAHDEFMKVLEKNPSGKYTKDAAYAQMLGMKNFLEYDETGGRGLRCKANTEGVCVYKDKKKRKKVKVSKQGEGGVDAASMFPESDYSENEKAMLGSYATYQKYVKNKKDKELPKIMYHRAKLAMNHNKFGDAKPIIEDIIERFDGSIYAAWCAEMLIDLLTIQWQDKNNTPDDTIKASDNLDVWSRKLMKTKTWKHEETKRVRGQIPTLLAGIRWKKAMAYQEQGKTGDPGGYKRCGQEYVDTYNEFENHDKADILLWNASLCYEAAYLVGQSIKLRNILLDKFPSSKKSKEALLMVAQNYRAIAFFDKSATRYEQYASKYTKDKDAREALQNAYLFRLGLGEEQKAVADLDRYERLYKRKDPKMAAKIFWSRHALLKTNAERMRHAEQYIKTYGGSGGADRRVVAEATIGQIIWRNSCEKNLLYDSCITIKRQKATTGEKTRKKARKLRRKAKRSKNKKKKKKKKKYIPPKNCGSATQGIITVHARSKKKSKSAQARFSNALKYAGKKVKIPDDDLQRQDSFKNAWGMAMVYKADLQYEEYLTIEMPTGLDFVTEDWKKDSGIKKWEKEYKEQKKKKDESIAKFKGFFERKMKLGGELVTKYEAVRKTKSPAWVLAAAARSAVVYQNFADQLYRAEVPRNFKTEDQYYAYCDELADRAATPQKKALDAFTYCLSRSTKFQFFNQFSRMCEEELQQRDPDKFPATNELFGKSIYTASRMDVVNVQTDLEGDVRKADPGKKSKKKKKASAGTGKAGL